MTTVTERPQTNRRLPSQVSEPASGGTQPIALGWRLTALACGLALTWYVAAATSAIVFGPRSYRLATVLGSVSADALATRANEIIQQPSEKNALARAGDLARRALSREPANASAVRALGLVAAATGDTQAAERLFSYGERLSRRDLSVQLWLIENGAQRGDVAGTLAHYDRALRTSTRANVLLLPVLARAADEPLVTRELGVLLAHRPPWWSSFFQQYVEATHSSGSLASLTAQLRLRPSNEGERDLLIASMVRLMQLAAYDQAFQLYRQAAKSPAVAGALLRNGDFNSEGGLPPFDWSFTDDVGLAAAREARPNDSRDIALHIVADGSHAGEVARQLLLATGSYRLSLVAGDVSGAERNRPTITITCAPPTSGGPEQSLVAFALPLAPTNGRGIAQGFTVPPNCPAQIIRISLTAAPGGGEVSPWIDSVAIKRQ